MYYIPRKGRGEWRGGPKWVDGPCAGARKKNMSLKIGQKINNVFGPNDPPPWYDLNAPRYARARTDAENIQETKRRCKARERLLAKKQLNDPLATLTPQEEEAVQTADVSKYPPIPGMAVTVRFEFVVCLSPCCVCNLRTFLFSSGYIGSAKGAKQMLWERGHWRHGLTVPCCRRILKDMPDFRLETSELSNLWTNRVMGLNLESNATQRWRGVGLNIAGERFVLVLIALCVRMRGRWYAHV